MKENIVLTKSFDFSLAIIKLFKELQRQKEFIISKQLLKSATSIGANANEAAAAQSKRDFIAKMSISSKEARETHYWLRLLEHSQLVQLDYKPYLKQVEELIRIITAIVKTSQENLKKN